MTTQTEAKYRRELVKRFIQKNQPVTVAEVANATSCMALESLPADPNKAYWIISKDTQILRRTGEIAPGAIVYRKLQD